MRLQRRGTGSCPGAAAFHVQQSELGTQWPIVNDCEMTQNELYCIVGLPFQTCERNANFTPGRIKGTSFVGGFY